MIDFDKEWNQQNKISSWIFGISIFLIVVYILGYFALAFIAGKTLLEVRKTGLKHFVEEIWEGKQ